MPLHSVQPPLSMKQRDLMPLKPLLLLTNSAETSQVYQLLLRTELAEQHNSKNLVFSVHVFIKKGLKKKRMTGSVSYKHKMTKSF